MAKKKRGLAAYRDQIFWGFLITLAIYIGFLIVADLTSGDNIGQTLARFPLVLILPLIALQTLVIFLRFIEWQYFLGVIDARHKISIADSLIIFVSSFTMVVSPGKAAELLKAVLLKVKTGVPIARSAPIVIAERVVDGLAVLVIMTVILLVSGDQLNLGTYDGVNYDLLSRTLIFSSTAMIAIGLIVIQIQPLAYFCLGILARLPLIKRLHAPLIEFYESSRQIFQLRHVIPMTLVGVSIYASSGLGFIIVLYGFGLEISVQLMLQALFIVGVASAVGALSFVPNGAGVTEISNTGMLLALVAPLHPIVTPAVATTAALLQGFFHKWFRVLVGLAVGFIFRERIFTDDFEQAILETQDDKAKHDTRTDSAPHTA
jgi:glycosyltransferase 2 family protein